MTLYARWLFGIAAAANFVVGAAIAFARPWLTAFLEPATGTNAALVTLAGVTIILFGVAYALVAHDPARNRPFVLLGAFGKVVAFLTVLEFWLSGEIGPMLPLLISGDLVFAALFLDYWRRTRVNFR